MNGPNDKGDRVKINRTINFAAPAPESAEIQRARKQMAEGMQHVFDAMVYQALTDGRGNIGAQQTSQTMTGQVTKAITAEELKESIRKAQEQIEASTVNQMQQQSIFSRHIWDKKMARHAGAYAKGPMQGFDPDWMDEHRLHSLKSSLAVEKAFVKEMKIICALLTGAVGLCAWAMTRYDDYLLTIIFLACITLLGVCGAAGVWRSIDRHQTQREHDRFERELAVRQAERALLGDGDVQRAK